MYRMFSPDPHIMSSFGIIFRKCTYELNLKQISFSSPDIRTTRSGRLSRPPAPKGEEFRRPVEKASSSSATQPEQQPEPQPKRKFEIPERYRCRVCQKIYLGDK